MDKKLLVVVMGQNCEKFIGMCLDSVKDADDIIYCDGGSTDNTLDIVKKFDLNKKFTGIKRLPILIQNEWNSHDINMNGKQRNFYLKYIKKNYPEYWCLVLDADELVGENGIRRLKKFINDDPIHKVFSVHMRHFIGDLGHEDSTTEAHFVPHRLFKISSANSYPNHSHPVLTPKEGATTGKCMETTIWHLGHLPVEYMDYILKRYKQHVADSQIHNQTFLRQWKLNHLFGQYPIKQIIPSELPIQICNRYELDRDEFYFLNRGLEVKHFLMVAQWKKYFNNKSVLDIGCGRGPFLCVWTIYDVEGYGFDKSKFAVMNPLSANANMWLGNLLDEPITRQFDLVTAIDILEHLEYEDIDLAIKNISKFAKKNVLFSIPFIGDANLDADPTHIIKENKEWWIDKLSKYFKIKDVPSDWLFAPQLLIGEKNEN